MTGPNPIAEALERDWQRIRHPNRHAVPVAEGGDTRNVVTQDLAAARNQWEAVFGHPFRHNAAQAAPETPAPVPVNLAAAIAAAATKENTMSLFDDAENIYAGAKNELAKFEQALPGVLAKAKQFEGSAFAQLAEKVAGSVLPPEAVSIAVNAADKVLDDLIGLYAPATAPADPAATGQQPVQVQ